MYQIRSEEAWMNECIARDASSGCYESYSVSTTRVQKDMMDV